ncbi:MAG: hypothetical protein F7C35_03365 [Desulfurococcales archaeon]|nr:hypothetical protein [Desulfurococcales archaeon]
MPGRRGQANVITLMILISITVALALLLYAYFTGVYTKQSTTEEKINLISTYSTSIKVTVEAFTNGTNTSTMNKYIYCGMLTLHNKAGSILRPGVTIVPGLPGPNGIIQFSPVIQFVPIDYTTVPPTRTLIIWYAEDYDHNGTVDLVGGEPDGPYVQVSNGILSCTQIYNNATLKTDPDYSLRPTRVLANNIVIDIPTDFKMLEMIKKAYPTAPDDFQLPVWFIPLDASQSRSLYFYIESPRPINGLTLLIIAEFGGEYYQASYLVLYSG